MNCVRCVRDSLHAGRKEATTEEPPAGPTWVLHCKLQLETAVSAPLTYAIVYILNNSIFDFILIHSITS